MYARIVRRKVRPDIVDRVTRTVRRRWRGVGSIHCDRPLEDNDDSNVAAVRGGVNQRHISRDHAEFIRIGLMQE